MYRFYRLLTVLAGPLLPLLLQWRLRRGKEDEVRMGERLGYTHLNSELPTEQGEARSVGFGAVAPSKEKLLWIHAASMGEAASALPLIDAFLARHPTWQVLVTTVTVTSARLMAEKLPPHAIHQFAPLDNPAVLRRFFARWQPEAAFWIESELWPNMARMTPCPMFLINARMSQRSFRRWRVFPSLLREMLQCFAAIFPQSAADAERFTALLQDAHQAKIICLGNLKYDAPPLSCNDAELSVLREAFGKRPLWLAASTHPGEEEQIAAVHLALKKQYPDLLTIIAPRHAPRGDNIAALLRGMRLTVAQRSRGETVRFEAIRPHSEIYLADTMGELSMLYRLSDIVFIGGSLVPHGGQNLLEAARLNSAIICGPHMHNFAAVTEEMLREQAVQQVRDADALQQTVSHLLSDTPAREAYAKAAMQAVQKHGGIVEALLSRTDHLLGEAG